MKNFFVISFAFLFCISCTETEDPVVRYESYVSYNSDYKFLKFENREAYNAVIEKLKHFSYKELDDWSNKIDFESQKFILYTSHLEDEEHVDIISKLPNEELKEYKKDHGITFSYSKYTLNNLDIIAFDDSSYDLKIDYDPFITFVIGKNGLVQIGDSIFQYSENNYKVIMDGDLKKISTLSNVHENTDKIMVFNILRLKMGSDNLKGRLSFWADESCIGYAGDQRIKGKAIVGIAWTFDALGQICGCYMGKPYAYLKAQNEKKNFFGNWQAKATSEMEIYGNNIDYNFNTFGYSGNNISVSWSGAGGPDIKEHISYIVYPPANPIPSTIYPPQAVYNMSGNALFYGRGGSQCSM